MFSKCSQIWTSALFKWSWSIGLCPPRICRPLWQRRRKSGRRRWPHGRGGHGQSRRRRRWGQKGGQMEMMDKWKKKDKWYTKMDKGAWRISKKRDKLSIRNGQIKKDDECHVLRLLKRRSTPISIEDGGTTTSCSNNRSGRHSRMTRRGARRQTLAEEGAGGALTWARTWTVSKAQAVNELMNECRPWLANSGIFGGNASAFTGICAAGTGGRKNTIKFFSLKICV